ncbi:MAG: hypothetical protein STSR0009_17740 [Methanoregula sp.]
MPRYESIRKIVTDLGYIEENHFRFERKIKSPVDGNYFPIHIDFLCDKCEPKVYEKATLQDSLNNGFT